MSHVRRNRRLVKWERFHKKYPESGAYNVNHRERYHKGHLGMITKVMYAGRTGWPRVPFEIKWH